MKSIRLVLPLILGCFAFSAAAQSNRINIVLPDAPELATFGKFDMGVRTLRFTDNNRPDIVNTSNGQDTVYYDRSLTVEIWYPATLGDNQAPGGEYRTSTRNTAIMATLTGSAVRDAAPLEGSGAFPLVIISHGYPGNRFLLSHLGESLASKGYVVASIDHLDSTYLDQQAIASTLYNRAPDQRFVLQQIANLSAEKDSFLFQLVNADQTAVVGYSMGGYGLLNNLGAGYNPGVVNTPIAPPNELLTEHTVSNPEYRNKLDNRIKAGIAIAPWGMNNGIWRQEDLQGIDRPTLYVAGSIDGVAGYDNGTRAIFLNTHNSDRFLLTFENAGHSAGAPIPPPVELLESGDGTGINHYTDMVWDNLRMNNIMDHFITAYLDYYLKDIQGSLEYLSAPAESTDTNWKGFENGPATGLRVEHLLPGQ